MKNISDYKIVQRLDNQFFIFVKRKVTRMFREPKEFWYYANIYGTHNAIFGREPVHHSLESAEAKVREWIKYPKEYTYES